MIKKGRGLSCIFYPTGFSGGGDPETVTMRLKRDGCIDVTNAISDLGQGLKMTCIQIAAETLRIDVDKVAFDNTNTATCSISIGAAGSRSTYVMGNATIKAGKLLVEQIQKYGAQMLGCDVMETSYDKGEVFVTTYPEKKVNLQQIGEDSYSHAKPIMSAGGYCPPKVERDSATGKGVPSRTISWGATIAEVSVDDETGVVIVDKLFNSYDVGTVINPLALKGQSDGGDTMGIGMALFEDLNPDYPKSIDRHTIDYTDYIIPTFMDIPSESHVDFVQSYDKFGPYGAKGVGEMVNNTQPGAIANAIHDAVGIFPDSLPITPEKILRMLDEKNKEQA